MTIGITAHFFKKMIIFAFPEKDAEVNQEEFEMEKKQKKKNRKSKVVLSKNNSMDDRIGSKYGSSSRFSLVSLYLELYGHKLLNICTYLP